MRNKSLVFALILAVSLAFVNAAPFQQKADDAAKDPVCGMTVKKSEAKATYDYKGTTYYFCSTGCQEAFAKEPEKYLAKAEQKSSQASATGMHQHGEMMPHGKMSTGQHGSAMECPLHAGDVEIQTESLPDGVTIKFTSKNPETVKKIQDHVAAMKQGCPGCGMCPHQKQVKK